MRKFIIILMALSLVAAVAVPAFATDPPPLKNNTIDRQMLVVKGNLLLAKSGCASTSDNNTSSNITSTQSASTFDDYCGKGEAKNEGEGTIGNKADANAMSGAVEGTQGHTGNKTDANGNASIQSSSCNANNAINAKTAVAVGNVMLLKSGDANANHNSANATVTSSQTASSNSGKASNTACFTVTNTTTNNAFSGDVTGTQTLANNTTTVNAEAAIIAE